DHDQAAPLTSTPGSLQLFKPRREVAQERRLGSDAVSGRLVSARMQFAKGFQHVIDMALRVYPPGNGQPDEFVSGRDELAVFVHFSKHDTAHFDAADTGDLIQITNEGLARVLIDRNVRIKARGIDIDGMAANRHHDGYPLPVQALA